MGTTGKRLVVAVAGLVLVYAIVAYLILPTLWHRYAERHPALDNTPGVTQTASGIPGDPINVALVGSELDIKTLMSAARWSQADALSLRSDIEIATDTVLERPYADAPVSSLYLWGRKEDLAFEQQVGDDPKQRHHVRFWRSDEAEPGGRLVWAGSATFDTKVEFSRTTGQITHHISADVDAERDHLFETLETTGLLLETYHLKDFHKIREGRNGGGDPWRTDGTLFIGITAAQETK